MLAKVISCVLSLNMPNTAQKHTSYADVKSILDGCRLPTAHTQYNFCHVAPYFSCMTWHNFTNSQWLFVKMGFLKGPLGESGAIIFRVYLLVWFIDDLVFNVFIIFSHCCHFLLFSVTKWVFHGWTGHKGILGWLMLNKILGRNGHLPLFFFFIYLKNQTEKDLNISFGYLLYRFLSLFGLDLLYPFWFHSQECGIRGKTEFRSTAFHIV